MMESELSVAESQPVITQKNLIQQLTDWETIQVRKYNSKLVNSRYIKIIKVFSTVFGPWSLLWMGFILWGMARSMHYYIFLAAWGGITLQSWIVFMIIKAFSRRKRPYLMDNSIKPLDSLTTKYGFPSGHAYFFSIVWFFLLTEFQWPVWLILPIFGLALFIGFTRIALGVHYPTDIIIGIAIAFVMTLIFITWTRGSLIAFYYWLFGY